MELCKDLALSGAAIKEASYLLYKAIFDDLNWIEQYELETGKCAFEVVEELN